MIRGTIFSGLLLPLILLLSGCCFPPPADSHNVNLYPQHRDWWCWAATTEMISDYKGHPVQQCDSVNFVHGAQPDCCTGCTGNCPCWGWPWGATIGDIQNNWTNWDFAYTYAASSLSWSETKKTLAKSSHCRKSPIYAVRESHVVVVTGYADIKLASQHLKIVFYNDPWPPDCQRDENDMCHPAAGGTARVSSYEAFKNTGSWPDGWWATFHSFKYTGP